MRPTERFSFYASGAFTDARYVKFVDAPCPPELSGGGAGTPIAAPGVSRFAGSYGFEYNRPAAVLGSEGRVYFGFDGNARTKFSSNASRSAYTDIGDYSLANVRLGFRSDDDWNLFGWVRNALDADYYDVLATQSGSTGLIVGQPGDPRTYGFTLSKTF